MTEKAAIPGETNNGAIPVIRGADILKRIAELKAEFAAGQAMLADLATKQRELETTTLRISGAIQVLEELLAPDAPEEKEG